MNLRAVCNCMHGKTRRISTASGSERASSYSGLHLGVQRKTFANFAPLRLCENSDRVGEFLAKAQRRKVRKGFSLNTQMQTAV